MTFKFAVRMVARRHGLYATFMPKPKTGVPGSACILISPSMTKTGTMSFMMKRIP